MVLLNLKNMNRTFYSAVGWWYWLLIAVSSVGMFVFFWQHDIWIAVILAVVVILEIEMLIHTRYVVTVDGKLKIESGRFISNVSIELDRIISIRKVRSMAFFEPALSFDRCELCFNRKNGFTAKIRISPKNREEFIRWMQKRNPAIMVSGN